MYPQTCSLEPVQDRHSLGFYEATYLMTFFRLLIAQISSPNPHFILGADRNLCPFEGLYERKSMDALPYDLLYHKSSLISPY